MISLILARAENGVIGANGALAWRLPEDMRRFKALTLGKCVLMGRKTYESIGRALPDRTNLVLSRSSEFAPGDCTVVATLEAARSAAGTASTLMVIGGAEIYRLCLPFASRIHLTLVHVKIEDGDAFFGGWRGPEWRETARERHGSDAKNSCAYSFITLDRSGSGASRDSISRAARP